MIVKELIKELSKCKEDLPVEVLIQHTTRSNIFTRNFIGVYDEGDYVELRLE